MRLNALRSLTLSRAQQAALAIFAILLAAYLSTGTTSPDNDTITSILLPQRILKDGTLGFTRADSPYLFFWRLRTSRGIEPVYFREWSQSVDGRPMTSLQASGALLEDREGYFLVPSTEQGRFVSTFGPAVGVLFLPFAALLGGALETNPEGAFRLWYAAKIFASVLVALSGLLVFLAAARILRPLEAIVAALSYGLGTCVFSLSSQGLRQHSCVEPLLALAALAWLRSEQSRRWAAVAGLALGLASACRLTCAVPLVLLGGALALRARRLPMGFLAAAAGPLILLGLYNLHYTGSPLGIGQLTLNPRFALAMTGSPDLFQEPFPGAAGLLLSPSRGLLFFSPFMGFALVGLALVFRDPAYRELRPLAASAIAMFLVAASWFAWWGGWTYGYRQIVDVMPFLALLLAPVFPALRRSRGLRACFAACLAWSIAVQVLGAFTFYGPVWNGEPDIDRPENHWRLWSLSESQPLWMGARALELRARLKKGLEFEITYPGLNVASVYAK